MLLAQTGYGRGNKVHSALDDRVISGLILSPKDERRERLEQCVSDLRISHPEAWVMMDPQFYVTTISAPRAGRLPEYDYYANHAPLSRTQFSPRQIAFYVRECIDYQSNLDVSHIISPTILFDDFSDSWSQISLNMAEASIDYHRELDDAAPLLVTIVTSEVAMRNATGMVEFLDALTALDVDGFYILVNRNGSGFRAAMDSRAMENLLYCIHVLATINDYRVVVGYSDWLGFLLHSAGATATATGWHQSLRQFSMSRFEPSLGGGRARKRYSSSPLLSNPLIVPELQDIFRLRMLNSVLSGGGYDNILSVGPAAGEARWTEEMGCSAHWFAVHSVIQQIERLQRPAAKVDLALAMIDRAIGVFDRFRHLGVNFEAQTGPDHLTAWRDALLLFRRNAGI